MNLILSVNTLDFPVNLEQHDNGFFRVSYGLDISDHLDYISAAHRFGECVLHSATCEGLLSDNTQGV